MPTKTSTFLAMFVYDTDMLKQGQKAYGIYTLTLKQFTMTLKMLGLYLINTLIIGRTFCSMLWILNELTLQKEFANCNVTNVEWKINTTATTKRKHQNYFQSIVFGTTSNVWATIFQSFFCYTLKLPEHGLGINMGKNINYP